MNEKLGLSKTQARTRKLLLTTMEKLLFEQKFEDITINDICERALVTRSTFYRYFDDKYELTEKMIEYIGERDFKYTAETTFFENLESFIGKNLKLISNLNPSNQNRLNFYTEFLNMVNNVITSYVNSDELSQEDIVVMAVKRSKSPEKTIEFLSGGLSSLLISSKGLADYKQSVKFVEEILTKLAK